MMNYKKLAFHTTLWTSIAILTGCTATYTAPDGNPNVANLTYSNNQSVYIKSNAIDCSGNQKLPTQSQSFLTAFEGGVDPVKTTKIVAGSVVTIGFTGSDLNMPAITTDNQVSSKVLSLLTKGKHDSSVSEDQFKQAAANNCNFMVSFIPKKDANYRYVFRAENVGHDIGGATFQCSVQIQSYQANKWTAVPVIPRIANQGQMIVNGVPSNCSTAGMDQLKAGSMSNIPTTTKVSKKFTIQSGSSTGGMITAD